VELHSHDLTRFHTCRLDVRAELPCFILVMMVFLGYWPAHYKDLFHELACTWFSF